MSVKSQQVTKPPTAKRVQASRPVIAHVRGLAGNHTMLRKLHAREKSERLQGAAQLKLAGNEPGNRYEQEADRMADQVTGEPESRVRRQAHGRAGPITAPRNIDRVLSSGRSLDAPTRAFMEQRFGTNFGNVRVHTDAKAAESAQALHARAFTLGNQVAFAEGEYRPTNPEGQRLIAHELTHVLQQRSGLSLGVQLQPDDKPPGGAPADTDTGFLTADERERYRVELGDRIGIVAQKWSLAISLIYTDEMSQRDEDLWGFVCEALFTFAGSIIGHVVGKFLNKLTKQSRLSIKVRGAQWKKLQKKVAYQAAKVVEERFQQVSEALAEGGKEWAGDNLGKIEHAPSPGALGWTEVMSDAIGRWAQELRDKYIVSLPVSNEGDAELLVAVEAYDEGNHPQHEYNEKVTEAWSRYRAEILPIRTGQRQNKLLPGFSQRASNMYQLRVAEIALPAYGAQRLAVVNEFIDRAGNPTGDYAFEKWVAPDLKDILVHAEDAYAVRRVIDYSDLLNLSDPELMGWLMEVSSKESIPQEELGPRQEVVRDELRLPPEEPVIRSIWPDIPMPP